MIERQFISQKVKLNEVEEFISNVVDKDGYSHTEIRRTPLGEKVTIYTSKPGLIVGRRGANIRDLTEVLKKKFGMENPQIEVAEVESLYVNAKSAAKYITHTFEKFGPRRFKSIGYRVLQNILDSGALGAEIVISGRGVPGSRSKTWRFSAGHLKKSGDISENFVQTEHAIAHLRSGAVGVTVKILSSDVKLPDKILIKEEKKEIEIEEVEEEEKKEEKGEKKKEKKVKEKKKAKKKEDGHTKEK